MFCFIWPVTKRQENLPVAEDVEKTLDSDFMDQGNGSTELAEVRVAVIYAGAVGSLQETFAFFAP